MDISYIVNPLVTSGVVAAVAGAGMLWLLWSNRVALASFVAMLQKKLFSRSGFFWTVNIIFMAVSVIHAGVFFGITGNGHDVPGVAQYLGFAVSFFLDLVTIILMQALLESKYRSDEPRARQFLLFIVICCSTSTFANLAISLNDFDASTMLPYAPSWIQIAAPYVLASFPLFVILMSIAAEMIVNVRPLDTLNESEYEADEKKRINLMQIRNDYLQRQADEELRTLQIRAAMQMNKRMRSGSLPKSFRWFWEKPVDIDAIITGVTAQLKATYDTQIEQLNQQLAEVKNVQPAQYQETFLDDTVEDPGVQEIVQIEDVQPVVNTVVPSADSSATAEQKTTEPKVQDTDVKKQVQKLLKKNPNLTAKQIAAKIGKSESYAQKLKAQIAKELTPKLRNTDDLSMAKPEPKAPTTDELASVAKPNGHRKITQPLDDLVPLEV